MSEQIDLTRYVPIEQLRAMQSAKDRATQRISEKQYAEGYAAGYRDACEDAAKLSNLNYTTLRILEKLELQSEVLAEWAESIGQKEVKDDETESLAAAKDVGDKKEPESSTPVGD